MNVIRMQLGHSSLVTTSRYLDHIAPEQVIEAMRARVINDNYFCRCDRQK